MKARTADRRYVKGADHPSRQIESTTGASSCGPVLDPSTPSLCPKCRGSLDVQNFGSLQGRSLEIHCRMCGFTKPLVATDGIREYLLA